MTEDINQPLPKTYIAIHEATKMSGFTMASDTMTCCLLGTQWWVFLAAAAIALGIAFLTISAQAIRAAVADPAKSLRSE